MYTSPSPLPRRAPLRLPFSVHIRKLFFLFLSLFSGAPRRTHPVGAGVCPSVCPAVAPFSHPVGAGVLDGPHRFSFMPTAGIFRAPMDAPVGAGVPDGPHRFSSTLPAGLFRTPTDTPRRGRRPRRPASFLFHASGGAIPRSGATSFCPRRPANFSFLCLRRPYFFQQRKKYGKERRQKPTVFGFPFSDCNCIIKRSHNESPVLLSPLPLPCTTRRCHAPLVCNDGYCTSSPRCGDPKGGDAHVPALWSLWGLRSNVTRARKRGIVLSAAGRNGAAGGKKRDGRFKASVSFFFPLMPRNS